MRIKLDLDDPRSYETFLRVKSLPRYRFVGRTAEVPDEYADRLGLAVPSLASHRAYQPKPFLFDYQRDIAKLAIRKQKFAAFVDCGLGKTAIMLEWVRHVAGLLPANQCVLIVSPLMVVDQTIAEAQRFYGDELPIERIKAKDLGTWLERGTGRIGITNYDALKDGMPSGRLGGLALDESSMLKSAYGKWAGACIDLGRGLNWKLCLTGTPAPNDRIEFANHAVFLDAFPTTNSFLAKFFVNRGQTDNRWEMKPHALRPFYRSLSDWSIFLASPSTYGWSDNSGVVPPIHVHIHEVDLTDEQRMLAYQETGRFFGAHAGGIKSRSALGRIAKGEHKGRKVETRKTAFIQDLVGSWTPNESTLVWCHYNDEQEAMEAAFSEAASIDGSTKLTRRLELIEEFQRRQRSILISKGKVLGFGLNLQVASRHVFSGLQDSYETYYQCVKRSNRYGSDRPLNVHIPVTEIEYPMVENVLRKADRVQADCAEQEAIFKECGYVGL